MAYTKTQESFKSFFKKLDSDRKEIKLSSSVSRERKQPLRQYQSGIVEEKFKLQKPPINTHLEIRNKTPKPNSERVYASISTVRPKSNYIKPTPGNLSAKAVVQRPNSGSLAERLEKRINDHRDNYRNKGNKMRNEISNQSSLFSPDITDLYRSEQSLPKSKPQSKPANQESNSRASNGSEEKTNNLQKPSIKIKQESKIHLESFQATPKKPPIEKSKSFHQVVSPKLLCNKSGDITTQINRMNTTVQDDFQRKNSVHGQRASFHNSQKSIRSSSAKSDASKKIDTSNEKYKERYAAVRQDTKRSSYVKLAEAKKNYKDPPLF